MMFIDGIAFIILGTMLWAPETYAGRGLRRWLVQPIVERCSRVTAGQVVVIAAALAGMAALVAFMGADGAMLIQMGAPEVVAWLTTFDVALLIDGLLATTLIASQVRVTRLRSAVGTMLGRRRAAAPRQKRRSTAPSCKAVANDDDPAPVLRVA